MLPATPAATSAAAEEVRVPDGIRFYVLDGGRVNATGTDAAELADDGAYRGLTLELPVPCFLIRHPEGDLMWDTGMSRTRTDLGDWATPPGQEIEEQLRLIGLSPADVRFLTVSHGHWDHSGNAGLFSRSTWIVNPAERASMFDDESRASQAMDDYGALEGATTRLITDDHDVFGDGSVVIVQAPGHTPGHMVLLVRLETGPVLLSGDLWHQTASRRHRRVPVYNTDRAQTLASMDRVEALVTATGARVVIQHELADYASMPLSPAYLR
jgi:N-acyl homoserine lactone hydrolase